MAENPPQIQYGLRPHQEERSLIDRNNQMIQLKDWFYAHYTAPVNSLPYDGREGGYQFCGNGPYDARDALRHKFGGNVPSDIIEEVADDLDSESGDWTDLGVEPQ